MLILTARFTSAPYFKRSCVFLCLLSPNVDDLQRMSNGVSPNSDRVLMAPLWRAISSSTVRIGVGSFASVLSTQLSGVPGNGLDDSAGIVFGIKVWFDDAEKSSSRSTADCCAGGA